MQARPARRHELLERRQRVLVLLVRLDEAARSRDDLARRVLGELDAPTGRRLDAERWAGLGAWRTDELLGLLDLFGGLDGARDLLGRGTTSRRLVEALAAAVGRIQGQAGGRAEEERAR